MIYWNLADGYAHCANPDQISISRGNMTFGENYFHGGLLRFDMTQKPAYRRLKKLLQETWHTKGNLRTSGMGEGAFRGFFGEYEVEISHGGKTVPQRVNVSKNSINDLTLVLA